MRKFTAIQMMPMMFNDDEKSILLFSFLVAISSFIVFPENPVYRSSILLRSAARAALDLTGAKCVVALKSRWLAVRLDVSRESALYFLCSGYIKK